MSKSKLIGLGLGALLLALVGCEEVANLPDSGTNETVIAPGSIINKVLALTITERFTPCSVPVGTVSRSWFVDENTVRTVRTGGGVFDQITTSWNYRRTGATQGHVRREYRNGSWDTVDLTFTASDSGTFLGESGFEGDTTSCRGHVGGDFEIEAPPSD